MILHYPGGPSLITKGLISGRRRQEGEPERWQCEVDLINVAGFEYGGVGSSPGIQAVSGRTSQGSGFSFRASRMDLALLTLDFGPVRCILDF